MRLLVIFLERGRYPMIRFSVFGWQLRISLRKLDARSPSSLGGEVRQNSAGYLVKDDPPQRTTVAPTAAAPRPESTSPSAPGHLAS